MNERTSNKGNLRKSYMVGRRKFTSEEQKLGKGFDALSAGSEFLHCLRQTPALGTLITQVKVIDMVISCSFKLNTKKLIVSTEQVLLVPIEEIQ